MTQRANIVAALRQSVAKIDGTRDRLALKQARQQLRVNIAEIDAVLKGGLALGEMHEIRCSLSRDMGCATGLLLSFLRDINQGQAIVWINEPATLSDIGSLFPAGAPYFNFNTSRLICVRPMHLDDCLWAAGEAASLGGLGAVILHIKGNPKSFDLSVSRKLMLRAQATQTPLFILRQAGEEEASSAATRWHIKPELSLPDEIYPKGLGHMRLTLTLEKNRNGQTGQWPIAWNPNTRSLENAATPTQSTHSLLPLHPSANRPDSTPEMGQVMAFDRTA